MGWIGAVERHCTIIGYSCNDRDNEKRTGGVTLGTSQSRVIGWRHSDLPRDGQAGHRLQHPQSKSTDRNTGSRTEARLKRVARYLLGEPVVRTDANWFDQDSKDQKCFSCVVVRFGKHVIDVVCSKQDVVSLSVPSSTQ